MSKTKRVTEDSRLPANFYRDVCRGLTKTGQKELDCRYFYDDVGSALFDAITLLPEYGLTRADASLLEDNAEDIALRLRNVSTVIELGSGSGSKTRLLLSKLAGRSPLTYCPVDISESALHRCTTELGQIGSVKVVPVAAAFIEGLDQAVRERDMHSPLGVLFLGSTIGNFEPNEARHFLCQIRQRLQSGDMLFLSADLQKEVDRMVAAYDDPAGVTAAFNLNILGRINRELQGNFVLSQFRHEARYNLQAHRIEMHLQSRVEQRVSIGPDLIVEFDRQETIRTECSYKWRPEDLVDLGVRSGFVCEAQWVDSKWPFAQSLFRAD